MTESPRWPATTKTARSFIDLFVKTEKVYEYEAENAKSRNGSLDLANISIKNEKHGDEPTVETAEF